MSGDGDDPRHPARLGLGRPTCATAVRRRGAAGPPRAAARGRHLPGAQQLELLRRLNEAGAVAAELATRVLEASAPGRGRPDLELVGSVEPLAFGPPPVDPADLSADELLRVATGLIAEDVHAAGLPEPRRSARPRPWRTRYRLVGDPMLADPRRADLVSRGRPPGGRDELVLVLGTDLGADAGRRLDRAEHRQRRRSRGRLGRAGRARLDALPDRIDLPRAGADRGRAGRRTTGSGSCSTSTRCRAWSAYAARSPRRPSSPPTRSSWPAGPGRCSACSPCPSNAARAAAPGAGAAAADAPRTRR